MNETAVQSLNQFKDELAVWRRRIEEALVNSRSRFVRAHMCVTHIETTVARLSGEPEFLKHGRWKQLVDQTVLWKQSLDQAVADADPQRPAFDLMMDYIRYVESALSELTSDELED